MLDKTNIEILLSLLKNGRSTHQTLADELNYSRPAIHQRITKLEETGYITGYKASVDYGKLGYSIGAFVLVNAHTQNYNDMLKQIAALSKEGIFIENLYRITGNKCILIKLHVSSTEHLREFHDNILKIEGMVDTNTLIIMQEDHYDLKEEYLRNYSDEE